MPIVQLAFRSMQQDFFHTFPRFYEETWYLGKNEESLGFFTVSVALRLFASSFVYDTW